MPESRPENDLHNIVSIVTGGSRGIGLAIALECARAGSQVAVIARNPGELRDARTQIEPHGQVFPIQADVTDEESVTRACRIVLNEWGRVDLLVNNAGRFGAVGPSWTIDADEWWSDIRTNVLGTHLWCRTVIPLMVERGTGRIVNMTGGGLTGPFEYGSAYGASKVAIARYTDSLAIELDGTGVRAFALNPGLVDTAMPRSVVSRSDGKDWFSWLKRALDAGESVPPEDAARIVVAIASGRFDALNGRSIFHNDDPDRLTAECPSDPKSGFRRLSLG